MINKTPTIFHITHWKAGSQWVAEILKQSAPTRFVAWEIADPHANRGHGIPNFYAKPLVPGKIYGTVYLNNKRFQNIVFGFFGRSREGSPFRAIINWWNFSIRRSPTRCFVVIRDLRDTLISLYFSTRYSHQIVVDRLALIRQKLNSISIEDGLVYLLEDILPESVEIQSSWIGAADVLVLRYENILDNEYNFFENLIEYCQIDVSLERLHDIVRYNLFEAAAGRRRGNQDISAHLRKGIAGDWRNYFTERVKTEFKKQYGKLLIDTGYEKDLNW